MLDSVYYTSYKQSFRGIITVGRSVSRFVGRSMSCSVYPHIMIQVIGVIMLHFSLQL